MIRIDQLSCAYGDKVVLKDVDLQFEAGRTYGIVGANGSGKTTFFNCLAGLMPFTGTIDPDVRELKHRMGFLQTEPYVFPRITGREYIRLFCAARKKECANLDRQNIFELPLDEYASKYSTGMRKKLAFTAVLLQENNVFILDEPFNGVDLNGNIMMMEIIHELRRLGKTTLIASHIFSTLKETCDEIHLLEDGVFTQRVERKDIDSLEHSIKTSLMSDHLERLGLK